MSLPATMRAIEIARPGGPEVLTLTDRPLPVPGPGEILIRVAAAGVNRPDALQRAGAYDPPRGLRPARARSRRHCRRHRPRRHRLGAGDRVTALLPGGGYADYAVTHEDHALPVPARLSFPEAAALCETLFTVWSNVFERGRLQAGESFLVHGGSSGIGTTAIQLAALRGARVFATAGSPEKCAACVDLGAERGIDYRREDFVAVTKELTAGRGVDVILDMVGGDYLARDVRALAPEDASS